MKVTTQFKGQTHEYSFEEQDFREGLDYAVRHNPDFWKIVLDVVGSYQSERLLAEIKRRRLIKGRTQS